MKHCFQEPLGPWPWWQSLSDLHIEYSYLTDLYKLAIRVHTGYYYGERHIITEFLLATSACMTGSKLKLTPSKAEFLLIGSKLHREKFLNDFPCLILGQDTNPSSSAKNLGVVFDSSLNFRKHISQTCRACFYHIHDLRWIRKSLSLDLAKQIAVALVSSKLDYCNSLFPNMPEKDIARLQRVQNCLARVVTKAPYLVLYLVQPYGTPCLCQYIMPKQC